MHPEGPSAGNVHPEWIWLPGATQHMSFESEEGTRVGKGLLRWAPRSEYTKLGEWRALECGSDGLSDNGSQS